jgi:Uri superfamily endonuclease
MRQDEKSILKTLNVSSAMNELGTAAHMLNALPTRGNYTLIISIATPVYIKISDRGEFNLKRGYCAYTGSAMGSGAVDLRHRVARHLRKRKTKHWHIDHLLSSKEARITAIVACSTSVNKECQITRGLQSLDGASVPIDGFGASDCRQGCGSHLVYCGQDDALEKIVAVHRRIAGKANVVCMVLESEG